ncbi:MAG: hypothetical protein MI867_28760 [Pseudomonadales bacterium]|nr:hypothetical protein [Pseudomonadales bacterium]
MSAASSNLNYVLAFPASDRLATNSDLLVNNLRSGASAPQNKLGIAVANDFADEVLKAMISNSLDPNRMSKVNIAILNQLTKMIQKSVHLLINKVVAKLSNDQLIPLADYIAETRLTLQTEDGEKTHIICPLDDSDVSLFKNIEDKVDQGAKETQVKQVGQFIDRMSAACIAHFFKKPTGLMELGVISRKIVDTSYVAVKKGTAAAVKSLVKNMNGNDVEFFLEDTRGKIVQVA